MPKVAENMMAGFIRQAEQKVNELRAKEREIQEDLVSISSQLDEARGVLHALKTARVQPVSTNGNESQADKYKSMDDYLTVIASLETEFTSTTIASAMNVSTGAANNMLKKFARDGIITVVREVPNPSGGRMQKVYRQCQ